MSDNKNGSWKLPASLVIAYAALLIVMILFHRWWSGEWDAPKQMIRMVGRLVGCAAVAWGLLNLQKWAYWTAMLMGSLFAVLGVFGLVVAVRFGIFQDRPYPAIDLTLVGLATLICAATAVSLLFPSAREKLKHAEQGG